MWGEGADLKRQGNAGPGAQVWSPGAWPLLTTPPPSNRDLSKLSSLSPHPEIVKVPVAGEKIKFISAGA